MKKIFLSLSLLLLVFSLCSCNNNTGTTMQNEDHAVPEVKSIFINGDSIHYIDIGKGDPVLFVHGSFSDYRTWGAQMDTFAKKHRVISYSRRFAYPNKQIINDSADYTVTAHSKDLTEFIKALNLERVHLVGHSYGAFIALVTTMDHPELVRSLTLGEPPVMPLLQNVPGGDTLANNFPAIVDAFKNNDQEKAVTIFFTGAMGDSLYFSNLPQHWREIVMANTLETRGALMSNKNPFPPVTCDDLKKIKTPVLLLQGDRSTLISIKITTELDRCLSNKVKAILPNSSHGLETQNPSGFNKIVLEFIDKH